MTDPYDLNNIALRRASADGRTRHVVPVTREALRKALLEFPKYGTTRWNIDQIMVALVRLGVAQQEPPR